MLLLDAGTTYSKVYDGSSGQFEILPTSELPGREEQYSVACGHFAKGRAGQTVNELVALAKGVLRVVDDDDFCVVDVGSRDIKFVRFAGRKYAACDWNQSCGAFTGFTMEMLERYFGLDYNCVAPSSDELSVTCGVFGMSNIFDMVGCGVLPEVAVASFVRGVAASIHRFVGVPDKLYLSGGLCENTLFMKSFPCELVPLGRFVIIEGLRAIHEKEEHVGKR